MKALLTTTTLLAVTAIAIALSAPTHAQTDPAENQPGYWCPSGGVKFEPTPTPYTVPEPPPGITYSLLVLKAGSGPEANATFPYPTPGAQYTHPSQKDISHVILCEEPTDDTTTTTSTTEPPPTTTTVPPTTTSTTEPPVTTTTGPPDTTTSVPTTTTVASETTTSAPTTTTLTTPECSGDDCELPYTGAPLVVFGALGAALLVLGLLSVRAARSEQ